MTTSPTLAQDIDMNTEVFEYLAVSILEVLPEEKLPELDEALTTGGDAVDDFLASNVDIRDDVLAEALRELRIIVSAPAV